MATALAKGVGVLNRAATAFQPVICWLTRKHLFHIQGRVKLKFLDLSRKISFLHPPFVQEGRRLFSNSKGIHQQKKNAVACLKAASDMAVTFFSVRTGTGGFCTAFNGKSAICAAKNIFSNL